MMNRTKILIVEDEAEIAESIKLILQDRGYIVVNTVATGEDAIETVKNSEVHLVLMDIVLNSEMSGTEAAEYIKSHYDIPIVFLTAYFNEYMLEQAKESLPFGYILKPFNERELYANIEMALYHDRMEKKRNVIGLMLDISNKINKQINSNTDKSDLITQICDIFSKIPEYLASFIILLDEMNNVSDAAEKGLEGKLPELIQNLNSLEFPQWFRKAVASDGILQENGSPFELNNSKKTIYLTLGLDQKIYGLIGIIINYRYLEDEELKLFLSIAHDISRAINRLELEAKSRSMKTALSESVQRYKQVIDNAADIIFTLDLNGKISFVNNALLTNTGYSSREIMQINFYDLILPEHKQKVQDFYNRLVSEKKSPAYIEYPVLTRDGETKWYGQNTNLLFDNSEIIGFHCISRDITERKHIEGALHESEKRYRQLVEMSPDAIIVYSKGKVIFTNDAGVKLFGAKNGEELIGQSIANLFYPHSIDVTKSRVKNLTEEDSNVPLHERQIKRLDHTLISVELTANKIIYQNESAFQVVIRDISERKRVERELRRRQREVTTLLDSLPAYAFFKDSSRRYITANQKFCDAIGCTKDEIIGKTDLDLFPIVMAEKFREDDLKVINSGEMIYVYEDQMYDHDKLIFVGTRKVPLKDETGKIIGLIGLAFDISERKAAEEAVKKYTKELEELNANKDKFFSIISHDLRSPFQGLLGLSNILVEEFDNLSVDEIKLFASNIHNSTKSLFNLLENLLQWSRIQTGKIDLKPVMADLREEVLYNINLLSGNASKKNIKLLNELNDTLLVYTDLNILNSTLQNLITNAIKFTHSGGEIRIITKESDGGVEVTVSDTGIGISEEDMGKLFRIDTQHTTMGTERESGTGLGLTICKELLEKQGGKIWVKSVVGKGSSFTFTLQKYNE